MSTRLYVPLTLPGLAEAWRGGSLPAAPGAVRAADASEDAEYAALLEAADASAALVAGLPDGARRRVVVVAEVADPAAPVPLAEVVAVHADADDDADPDDDLAWWATQEVPDLVGSL